MFLLFQIPPVRHRMICLISRAPLPLTICLLPLGILHSGHSSLSSLLLSVLIDKSSACRRERSTPKRQMADSTARREMAQVSYLGSTQGAAQSKSTSPRDDIILALLAAASNQYTPIVPSPLNPTLCEKDAQMGRHAHRLRKARSITKKPPEISPTLRLLRRKAFIAHQHARTTSCSSSAQQERDRTIIPDSWRASPDVMDGSRFEEAMPAVIVESGPCPLIQVVHWDYVRNNTTADMEKQTEAALSLLHPSRGPRQRFQFFFILVLVSACSTFLTVFGLDVLGIGQHFAS